MNILLLHFPKDNKLFIKKALSSTSLTSARFFDANDLDSAISKSNWEEIDFICCYLNDDSKINCNKFQTLKNTNPLLIISHPNYEISKSADLIEGVAYLPENQITSFILETFIKNTLEKFQIKDKLKQVEQIQLDLSLKEAKYRNLFENSAIGMYEVDTEGNFLLANQVLLNILGLHSFEDLREFNAFEKGISTNGTREKLFRRLKKEDKVENFEDEWLKTDKTKIFIKESIQAQKDEKGIVRNYYGVVQDITESKNVQFELLKSKKDAEKSDQLKSEFLTQISHEIRTPVNTLLSFSTLIEQELKDSLSNELIDCFEHMNKAGERIIRTIDLLVKMSELHTDNYEPEFKENNLFDLLDNLVKFYTPLAEKKGLELDFVKALDNATAVFDQQTMYDVFSNIIDNAIKYTMEGGVKIYIKKSVLSKIVVSIIDTGIGISEKYINNIFTPFSQETTGYTREFDGNGLGLALVKEYCDLNNTDILVTSEKNSGSNFTVIFK